jgi:uncharacterized protein
MGDVPAKQDGLITEKVLSTPRAAGAVLVCGLPGSGYVGKLAADHLVTIFRLKKVAEYTSETFPPQANVGEEGVAEPVKGELYFGTGRKGDGLMVFTADAQPATSEGEYSLSDAVVKFAKKCGVKKVYTLAAYITGSFSATPKVYGAATSKVMLDALAEGGATVMKEGGISGMNGLLIGIASLRGLQGACLLGETSGYVVDAGASKQVLEVLAKLTGTAIDTSKLREKAEETQKVIRQLQAMSEQARETAPQPKNEPRPGYIG